MSPKLIKFVAIAISTTSLCGDRLKITQKAVKFFPENRQYCFLPDKIKNFYEK